MRFNFMISYSLAGAGTALAITLLVMGMLKFSPPAIARLEPIVQQNTSIRDGIIQKKDMFGLIQSKTDYVNGFPHGGAIHFYPNKSIARVLEYQEGKLHGFAREYYEFMRDQNVGARGKAGLLKELSKTKMGQIGFPKAVWSYQEGVKQGPYELYYNTGGLKEQGVYLNDRKLTEVKRFTQDGEQKGV